MIIKGRKMVKYPEQDLHAVSPFLGFVDNDKMSDSTPLIFEHYHIDILLHNICCSESNISWHQ